MDYHHATDPENVESIFSAGLRLPFVDDGDSSRPGKGYLGHGVYISSSWQMALWFGRALLRVQLTPGTNILDVSDEPDARVIRSLRREFGSKLLSSAVVLHEVIPANKQLTLSELTMLTKYHYHRIWTRGRDGKHHGASLRQCLSMLRRYRFDGFGHLTSDVGIIILSPDRVEILELVAVVRERPFIPGESQFRSIDELRTGFRRNGEKKYVMMADQYAARNSDSGERHPRR